MQARAIVVYMCYAAAQAGILLFEGSILSLSSEALKGVLG